MENQLNIWKNKKWDKEKMNNIFLSENKLKNKSIEIIKIKFCNKRFRIFKNNNYINKRGSKIVILRKFFHDVLKKNPNINCVIYLILNEHVTIDKYFINIEEDVIYNDTKIKKINEGNKTYNLLNEYPFFTIVKPPKSNLICIPDTIFLNNYSKWSRGNNKVSLIKEISMYNNESKWENKKNMFVFKSNYWKYCEIKKIINECIKNKNVGRNYLKMKDQIKHYKYLIGTFLRWDTTYWQLLSNSPVFMIVKLNNKTLDTHPVLYHTFLSYYFKPNIHYIPIQLDKISEVNEKYKSKNHKLKKIAFNSTVKAKELTYEKIVNDFSKLLVEFNKIYNNL